MVNGLTTLHIVGRSEDDFVHFGGGFIQRASSAMGERQAARFSLGR